LTDYELRVRVRRQPGYTLVTVSGEIDIATVPRLRGRLAAAAAGGRSVIVDMSRVGFIDASGLGVLARAAGQARARGTTLHVAGASRQVQRLFAITGLDHAIPLARTVSQAVAALPGGSTPPDGRRPHAPCGRHAALTPGGLVHSGAVAGGGARR